MAIDLASRAAEFIARMGDRMAKMGLAEPQGQVFAWLLIADPPCQTVAEIAVAVQRPESQVAEAVTVLTHLGLLDRVEVPQAAALYASKGLEQLMAARTKELQRVLNVLDDGLMTLADEPPHVTARLNEYRDFYGLMKRELPMLLAKWRAGQPVEGP